MLSQTILHYLCSLIQHPLPNHIKRRWPNIQYSLVEFFLGEPFPPLLNRIPLQFQQLRVPDIIFQIICRICDDQVVDIFNGIRIGDPVTSEKGDGLDERPALVVDAHIGEGIETKDHGSVFLHQGCLFFGDRRVIITHHLAVGSPAFGIAAVIQKIADGVGLLGCVVGSLVQVSRITFMCECREE